MDICSYLRDMETTGLLPLLYNGWRILNELPELETVSYELVIHDEAFCQFTKDNLEDEFKKGI